jgi:hypothetical protein
MSVDELLETIEGEPPDAPNTTGDNGDAGYVRTGMWCDSRSQRNPLVRRTGPVHALRTRADLG